MEANSIATEHIERDQWRRCTGNVAEVNKAVSGELELARYR